MAFSLDDLFEKAAIAFEKSAEDHYRQADQAEALSDLFTDEDIRDQIDSLIVGGTVLAATVGSRLKGIFAQNDEETEPEPEPAPEPEAAQNAGPFSEDFQDRLRKIVENLSASGIFSDEDQPRRGTDRFPGL